MDFGESRDIRFGQSPFFLLIDNFCSRFDCEEFQSGYLVVVRRITRTTDMALSLACWSVNYNSPIANFTNLI